MNGYVTQLRLSGGDISKNVVNVPAARATMLAHLVLVNGQYRNSDSYRLVHQPLTKPLSQTGMASSERKAMP